TDERVERIPISVAEPVHRLSRPGHVPFARGQDDTPVSRLEPPRREGRRIWFRTGGCHACIVIGRRARGSVSRRSIRFALRGAGRHGWFGSTPVGTWNDAAGRL